MHVVGFIIRIYDDAQSPERQILYIEVTQVGRRSMNDKWVRISIWNI